MLAACPASLAPLPFLQEQLADVEATQRCLNRSRHTDVWLLSTQNDLPKRCRRLRQRVEEALTTPLEEADAEVLQRLLSCPALLEDHLVPTRTIRASIRRLVDRGLVLQDGKRLQRLDESQCCAFPSRHAGTLNSTSACPFEVESERESPQHLALKRAAAEALRAHFGSDVATLDYEVRFPHIRRIADAVITLRDGSRVAVEAQLSPLTLEQLQHRTHSYLSDEIEVVWVFLEHEQGGLKPGGLWDTCREWLLDEGYLVLTARATTVQSTVPLPHLPGSA